MIAELERRKGEGEEVGIILGNTLIDDLQDREAWRDGETDLGYWELAEDEVEEIGSWVYRWPDEPPAVPAEGSYVIAVGFPVFLREGSDPNDLSYGALGMMLRVTVSSAQHLSCQFERQHYISYREGEEIPPFGTEIGGMSGGPVFLVGQLHFPLEPVRQTPLRGMVRVGEDG